VTDDAGIGHPLRLAVVGLGLMGERHCRIISSLPGVMLRAVYDHHEERIQAVAAEMGCWAVGTYDELLKDPELDGVAICLPSGLHAEYGCRALESGKHVIMEKPLDSSVAGGRRLVEASASADRGRLFVISQYRYCPGLAAVRKAVDEGLFGKMIMCRASVRWYRDDTYYLGSNWRGRRCGENGGVLINQAVHAIDALLWLLGRPQEVQGLLTRTRPEVVECEDTAVLMFRWTGGTVGTLEASTSCPPGFDDTYEFHGETAWARVEKGELTGWKHSGGLPAPVGERHDCPEAVPEKLRLVCRQYVDILDAISGGTYSGPSPDDALAVIEIIDKIYRSDATSTQSGDNAH